MDRCKPVRCDTDVKLLPMQYVPPLHHADEPKGTAGLLQFGANSIAGAARTKLRSTTSCLRGSNSGSFLRVYPEAVPINGYGRNAAGVLNQSFPSPR